MSKITTHVLDTSSGNPAAAVVIKLFAKDGKEWKLINEGITDDNGRISDFIKPDIMIEAGIYKMNFETGAYFKKKNVKCFYPYVEIIFELSGDEHYHIPLLLNPYGYTTYRGS